MKKRYAIITDIHGNIEGLNAVLEDIKTKDELQIKLYDVVKDGILQDKELKQLQKRYFQILYNMLLGNDRGPKLGLFLMAIDKDKIVELL